MEANTILQMFENIQVPHLDGAVVHVLQEAVLRSPIEGRRFRPQPIDRVEMPGSRGEKKTIVNFILGQRLPLIQGLQSGHISHSREVAERIAQKLRLKDADASAYLTRLD